MYSFILKKCCPGNKERNDSLRTAKIGTHNLLTSCLSNYKWMEAVDDKSWYNACICRATQRLALWNMDKVTMRQHYQKTLSIFRNTPQISLLIRQFMQWLLEKQGSSVTFVPHLLDSGHTASY